MSKNKHLSYDERCEIQKSLNLGLSFKAIGRLLNKDCTTIAKEVKSHLTFEKEGAPYKEFNDCSLRYQCNHIKDLCPSCNRRKSKCCFCSSCTSMCADYKQEICDALGKAPYVCNGCSKLNKCTLEKRFYKAKYAQKEYETVRSESRSGFNLTDEELKQLDDIISPLLKKGHSLRHIIKNNADKISCCEKTAYTYADNGLFSAKNIDMPRKVRFRPRKKKSVPLKVDKACRIGRTYEDFKTFIDKNPSLTVTQLDSVVGTVGGSVLLTIHFPLPRFQLAFLRNANNAKSVTDIFDELYSLLGDTLYRKLFPICLADNGPEFSNPTAIEKCDDNDIKTHVFYCDPNSPYQKGACENNHEFIRRIIPKGTNFSQYTQKQIDLMMNHINSYSRPELGDKSPYEAFEFYYGKEALTLLGAEKIPPNEVVLRPSLLNTNNN